MTVDFMFQNPSTGKVAITSKAYNYVLAARGTLTTVTKPTSAAPNYISGTTLSRVVLTGSFYIPMLAFRCGSYCWVTRASAAVSLTGAVTHTWVFWVNAAPGATIQYWIFDLARNGLAMNVGTAKFELYNGGQLAFSSRHAPLRCRGRGLATIDSGQTGTFNYPGGYTYATATYFDNVGNSVSGNIRWEEGVGLKWSGTTLTTDNVQTTGILQVQSNQMPFGSLARWLLIDVTNL